MFLSGFTAYIAEPLYNDASSGRFHRDLVKLFLIVDLFDCLSVMSHIEWQRKIMI